MHPKTRQSQFHFIPSVRVNLTLTFNPRAAMAPKKRPGNRGGSASEYWRNTVRMDTSYSSIKEML